MRFPTFRSVTLALLFAAAAGCDDKPEPQVKKLTEAQVAPTAPVKAAAPERPAIATATADAGVKAELDKPTAAPVPTPTPTVAESLKTARKLEKAGQLDEAIAALEQAETAEPKNATLHVELARLMIANKDIKGARLHADLGVNLAPKSSAAWNTKGRVALIDKRIDAATEAFENATKLNDENIWAMNNLGLAYLEDDRVEDAIGAFEKAVQTTGKPETYMITNLGVAYEKANRMVEARAAYKQAAERGSDVARAAMIRIDDAKSAQATPEEAPATK